MRNLYGTISINKVLGDICIMEKINYYKLKNSKYGLEIVKSNGTNEKEIERTNMKNVTDNEEKIEKVLNDLIINEITPSADGVIEDLLKTYAC